MNWVYSHIKILFPPDPTGECMDFAFAFNSGYLILTYIFHPEVGRVQYGTNL